MRPNGHLEHGPRRRWWAPWSPICRCGLGAWPCYAEQMLRRQATYQLSIPRPPWNGPTRNLPPHKPLLTRGQEARTRQPGRW